MKTLLQLNASIHGENGASSRLSTEFVKAWRESHGEARVIRRDLAAEPVPHLTAERFGAFTTPAGQRSAAQQAVVDESDALIAELQRADVIVIGLPMYNFGVPSQLKAWIDHVARAGLTFRYTDQGPVGLVTGKKVYVFATRGGAYAGTALDTQTNYLRDFLRFIGITDVEFVYAEGLAMGERRQQSLDAATDAIARLTAPQALAA